MPERLDAVELSPGRPALPGRVTATAVENGRFTRACGKDTMKRLQERLRNCSHATNTPRFRQWRPSSARTARLPRARYVIEQFLERKLGSALPGSPATCYNTPYVAFRGPGGRACLPQPPRLDVLHPHPRFPARTPLCAGKETPRLEVLPPPIWMSYTLPSRLGLSEGRYVS
jgi:hypothetical protein